MGQKRSILDFFSATPTPNIETQASQDGLSDGDEIVVASQPSTPAKVGTSSQKTKRRAKAQSSIGKTRPHKTPARRNNKESSTDVDNLQQSAVPARPSSTPLRISGRSTNKGQSSSRINKNGPLPFRSTIESPVKLPVRSPISTSPGGQTKPGNRYSISPDHEPLDETFQFVTSGESEHRENEWHVGKRVLTAVRIPGFANKEDEDADQHLYIPKPSSDEHPNSMDLDTEPSLTSVEKAGGPVSTQTSSRRVMRNGLQAVTNSDSEGSDSSGEEGLGDVSVFIPHKRKGSPHPEEHANQRNTKVPYPSRQSSRLAKIEAERLRRRSPTNSPPQTAYKHSLANMVAQFQESKQAEARISSLENQIVEAQVVTPKSSRASSCDEADLQMLAAATGQDGDERERMLQAFSRVDALKEGRSYHFFLDHTPLFDNSPFPTTSLTAGVLDRVLADEHLRGVACADGIVKDMLIYHPLPMEVTLWMAQQLCHEPDHVLREAYVEILHASLQHETSISDTIGRLSCFYKTRSFSESLWKGGEAARLPSGLSHLLRVVSFTALASDARIVDASPTDTSAAILDFASMLIDKHVRQDNDLWPFIVEIIEDMLKEMSEESFKMLVSEITATLLEADDMSLRHRCNLITSFPAGTPRARRLQRSLALSCFTTTTTVPNESTGQSDWTKTIIRALQSKPELQISEGTDYEALVALIEVLDIAIGPGFSDLSVGAPIAMSDTDDRAIVDRESAGEKLHNKQVDALALHLQAMASRIRDNGARHFRRIEAKTTIERVVVRLEHSVRTRPKPKRGIFDDGNAMQTGQTDLAGFFARINGREKSEGQQLKDDEAPQANAGQ